MNLALGLPETTGLPTVGSGAVSRELGADPARRSRSAWPSSPSHDSVPRWALDDALRGAVLERHPDRGRAVRCICAYEALPGTVTAVGPFAAFSIDGPLDHSLIGVLAGLPDRWPRPSISILARVDVRHRLDPGPGRPGRPRDRGLGAAGHTVEIEEEDE